MRTSSPAIQRLVYVFLLLIWGTIGKSQTTQTLRLTDFAIWGGSGPSNPYTNTSGVFITNAAKIQGNIGSNHLIDVKNDFKLTGNIYSGNIFNMKNNAKITGDVFTNKLGTNLNPALSGGNSDTVVGNLTANGKIAISSGKLTGKVAVPAPSNTNYSGPAPSAGFTNTLSFPVLPSMPTNTPFDNQVAANISSNNITNPTTPLSPGVYRKLALTGNKTLTFNGPGNYIFYEVDNGATTNKFVFDFKNTSTGTINIFIIKDARWGRLSVSTVNGNFPSRIFTEVHGNGSTFSGNCFDLQGAASIPSGSNVWLGNVWAPNGGITVSNTIVLTNNTFHIIGALWSGKNVSIQDNLKLLYQAPVTGPNFSIKPLFTAPSTGKVSTGNNTIGAELFSLSQNPAAIASDSNNTIFLLDNTGKVMIEVISATANDGILKTRLINAGMTGIVDNGDQSFVITGNFPIIKLGKLNKDSALNTDGKIKEVYPLYPPIPNAGLVTTQGDVTMRSNVARSRFGLDGSGVKIGVISDSYDSKQGAQTDVNEGDLPGIKTNGQPSDNPEPVQVVQDLAQRGNDEGRAMLQIVHDIAPQAKLAFCTGFLSANSFARAIEKLAADTLTGGRCDVIVDDITYITEPFLNDGVVAAAVNKAVSKGVAYFSSAGNFGKQSYEAAFNGVTNTSVMPTGQIHNFASSGTDIYQPVNLKPGSYTIVLQWSDEFASSGNATGQTDLDLYLVDANGITLFGFNRSNLFGDPFEVCPFTVSEETNAKIMVVRAAGTGNVRFKYIIFRGDATILNYQTGGSTIVGHPNADGAIAVGAMLYANIPPFTPIWPGVASFSSRGGTSIVQNNTTLPPRNKPELIGPNGVNTTVNLGGAQFNDGDTYPNFFGTSAAAPHVAAVGALLIQERKKYNLQTIVTPAEVRQQLQTSAGKFSNLPGNFSFEGGYGYVQADSAAQQIANAKPIISTLETTIPGAQRGTQPFQVKITGKYLAGNAQIYESNTPVATTVSIDAATGVGTATATIPAIPPGNDPSFQLYNPPKSPSGLDGGMSEVLHFFSVGTKIVIKADDKSRKYGQENPVLTAHVSVIIGLDTSDINQTSLTLANLKLDNLTFATNAATFSSPRSYGISVERTTPLANDDTLLTLYTFEFLPGTLTVEKMPLKIIPNYKTIKYGDDLSGITYSYQLDTSGVVSPNLLEEIKSIHRKSLADNALIVLNGFNSQNPALTAADLDTMGMMASFQSVLNARKFIVDNGQLRAVNNNLSLSQIGEQRFIVDVSAQSLQNYKVNHSQSTMVVSSASNHARAFLNIKALTNGSAKAAVPGGLLQPMVNGQLLAMVNGQLQTLVNGQLHALVNGVVVDATDLTFQNGQLLALENGTWVSVPSGQIFVTINDQPVTIDLSVSNGQLQAIVNGQQMTPVNGELQATVNGQLLAIENGQLKALVNGQLMPLVNGELVAVDASGVLQPLVNGQLVAIVNGQLMIQENGELEIVDDLSLSNGQLKALVNGQLKALVNGQLKALVNGVVTDVPTTNFNLVNGQLRAIVNGETVAYVNGQLLALVNGQLKALVNGAGVAVQSVTQLANGQLKALVNGVNIPIANGQLQALVNVEFNGQTNSQLLSMVNGQLMAIVNGELTFVVFQNGQLKALVNGELQPQPQLLTNGQLKAIVNGELDPVSSASIANGQLKAIVNGEEWVYPNGQLKALVNGQLQALVNNFDVSGTNNNTKTLVLVDEDDINLQAGDVGGMVSMNMITGLDVGYQALVPGAFVNENFDVSYGLGQVLITRKPLYITADHKTKNAGEPNPPLTVNYSEFAFDETPASLCQPIILPPTPKSIDQTERRTTYTHIQINGTSNVYHAAPGETLTLAGDWSEVYFSDIIPGYIQYCPGCITQNYIGMTNDNFTGNQFDVCYDVTGLFPHSGTIFTTFTAPSRPGVYYITQQSSFWFSCYQFGHLLQDQIANDAIAVVFVDPSNGVTANTTATDLSPEGNYPITVGGCYFSSNYRIIFRDDTLTIGPGVLPRTVSRSQEEINPKGTKLYPNPASTVVRLRLENDVQSTNDIDVYDEVGKLNTSSRRIGEGLYEINVSKLPRGVYLIKAKTSKGVKTFKFIKM